MNKEHRELFKNMASVVAVANESRPIEEPINFASVQEVAYRELQVSNNEEKALHRVIDFCLAQSGENITYDRDLDLFPSDYLYNIKGIDGKLDWLEANTTIEPKQIGIVAAALESSFDSFENIHAWTRLEILKNTGEISSDLYTLAEKLEREVSEQNDL